jgi:hypothetical protein
LAHDGGPVRRDAPRDAHRAPADEIAQRHGRPPEIHAAARLPLEPAITEPFAEIARATLVASRPRKPRGSTPALVQRAA